MPEITETFDFDAPPGEPLTPLQRWLDEARQQTDLPNPNAMTLATVDADGRPRARIVLLKGFDDQGVVFFTNYTSAKARELHRHPVASLLVHWDPLNRQVRIDGRVSKVSDAESDEYFAMRPRRSQIGAWASDQSSPLASRAELDNRFAEFEARFEGRDVPRPPHWGGYRVSLDAVEFWQGRESRLHDRVLYTPNGVGGWRTQRLYP